MNHLIYRFNRIVQRVVYFILWTGVVAAALIASLWGLELE